MQTAFAGQRESLITASKQSFRSSPATFPFSQSDNLSSIVPSLNLLPDFEQEFTKAVSVIKSNIDKNSFIDTFNYLTTASTVSLHLNL
jgi:hypothetical protein